MLPLFLFLISLLGFEVGSSKPKYSLHKQEKERIVMKEFDVIIIMAIIGVIFLIGVFLFITSCTDSGLFYNHALY